jgi:hypothetical protein
VRARSAGYELGKYVPGGSDVCLEALRERVDVFFQPGETQGPSDRRCKE